MAAVIRAYIDDNPIILFSKTYCPFCKKVKVLFEQLGVEAEVVELNEREDGPELQAGLEKVSGANTVPQVFIGGKYVGGCESQPVTKHTRRMLVESCKSC